MSADPLLFLAGQWLGASSGLLALLTAAGFALRWGIRFRLVGVTSFTALLALSCLAFSISYTPRVTISGAVVAPVVFDGGADLVIAAAPPDLPRDAWGPTALQVASNLRGGGRTSPDGQVTVRLRRIEPAGDGAGRPVVLAEAVRDLSSGEVRLNP
ncbi:MAG: Ycf51 family protein [Cyanobium sp.]